MPKHIEIHIDRIVLEGYDPAHAPYIGEAIQAHLTSLVSQSGLPDQWVRNTHIRRIPGGPLETAGIQTPQRIGAGIARSVYQGIHRISAKQR